MNDLDPPDVRLSRHRKRIVAIGLAAAIALLISGSVWWASEWLSATTDSEITAGSPIRNVHSDVKYVGDEKCARCHSEIARTYREHPMGRSLRPVMDARIPVGGSFPAATFSAKGLEYSVEARGDRLFHKEVRKNSEGRVIAQHEAESRFVLGSGEQAMAFVLDRGGRLFQSPITWYARKQKWDLSPGYERDNPHFERSIKTACLFCHSNRFDQVEGTENRYREPIFQGHAIGCERCHGPGELHVKDPEPIDQEAPNIVNPAHLEPALRESVCQQCHLQGDTRIVRAGRRLDEYRPGLPLHRFESIFVKGPSQGRARFFGQVEQMYESRCFVASKGKMGCISCHDPHSLPSASEKVDYYRARCMECHAEKGCRLPREDRLARHPDDSCIECHMPKSSNEQIPHVASTLHLIPRSPSLDDSPGSLDPRARDQGPLIHFHQNLLGPKERAEVGRDLGIALTEKSRAISGLSPSVVNRMALPLIQESLATRPNDPPAWEAKGNALWQLGRREEAMAALRTALAKAPDREETLVTTGSHASQMGRLEEALDDCRRLIAINPWRSDYHQMLALVYTQRADWPKSIQSARDALALNPFNVGARLIVVQSLLKNHDPTGAKAEFQALLECDPPGRDALQDWYSKMAAP